MDFMSGVAITKQIYELLKIIKEGRDQQLVKDAAGDLSEKITALQMLNAELSGLYHSECQKSIALTQENAKIKMFITNVEHYTLHKTPGGSVTYIPKDATKDEISPYHACAHCYQEAVVSILQPSVNTVKSNNYFVHQCPRCKNEYRMDKVPPIQDVHIPPARRW